MIKYFPESKQFDGPFRHQSLINNLQEEFKTCKTLLYVGARPERMDHIDLFTNFDITILEIFPFNVKTLQEAKLSKKASSNAIRNMLAAKSVRIVEGNVIDFKMDKKFDVSMWWHGPEHVSPENLELAITNLENHTLKTVILGCPWGLYADHHWENPYESHISHNQPEFFDGLGYDVEVQGKEGPGSNLLSIKKML